MNVLDNQTKNSIINLYTGFMQQNIEIGRRLLTGESINYNGDDLEETPKKNTKENPQRNTEEKRYFEKFCNRTNCRFNENGKCPNQVAIRNGCDETNNFMYWQEK